MIIGVVLCDCQLINNVLMMSVVFGFDFNGILNCVEFVYIMVQSLGFQEYVEFLVNEIIIVDVDG